MLAKLKMQIVEELVATSSKEELIWLNGYFSGLVSGNNTKGDAPVTPKKITIVYGTETGNSKKLATGFGAFSKKEGINAKVISLEQYRLNDLVKEENFVVVMSTQGDGEPPAAALKFFNHLHENSLKLDQLNYGVLALGDSAYPLFCKAGEDVDSFLKSHGANPLVALQRCDTDYEATAFSWFQQLLQSLQNAQSQKNAPVITTATQNAGGKKWHTGTVITHINLNDKGSAKETYHIEVSAEGLDYEPGDSMGIIPQNNTEIVAAIISITGIDAAKKINYKNNGYTVSELLVKKLNIRHLPERVVQKYALLVGQEIPFTRIDLIDLLKIYPVQNAAQFEEVLLVLEPITPRLYSISSSLKAYTDEVHITVAKDSFCINEEMKYGLCSNFLSQLQPGCAIEFYIHKNSQFKLPDADKPLIMIGPGTGIAPFRAFLSERDAIGAGGKNWLFFGEQHFTTDFLYQTEMQNWLETGVLSNLHVAFSRDQKEKIYVQHKMKQHAFELYNWLQQDAYIYVCGAREPMSMDVEKTLMQIIEEVGGKSKEEALRYLEGLTEEGRYLKDVY